MATSGGGGGLVFGGTTQKCRACEKTVYQVDQLNVDNRVYHRACFRCRHCKGTLKLSNYSSLEGVPYCKPHFDQLFKMTGSLDKSFEGVPRADRSISQEGHAATKVSSMFLGTQDKCVACKKTVYPIEKVAVDGNSYHRPCFKCAYGNCLISPSSYVAHEGRLYCKHHHSQLFKEKGNFSQFDKHEVAKESNGNLVSAEKSTEDPSFSRQSTDNPVSPNQSTENPKSPTQSLENPRPPTQSLDNTKSPTQPLENPKSPTQPLENPKSPLENPKSPTQPLENPVSEHADDSTENTA